MTERETEELTAEALETWDASASGWEANADWIARGSEPVTAWLIDRLDPKPGDTILELGAGPGDTGFEAARRVGGSGRLLSTDIAPNMSKIARQRAEAAGIENVDFRVIDAQKIELDDDAVDGVIHRYGPMLLPEPASSLSEVRRVLREGRYVTSVWSEPENNPWILSMGMSLMMNGIEPPGDPYGPGGIFSLADESALRALMQGAGFDNVETQRVDQPFEFTSFEDFWRLPTQIAGPISMVLRELPEEKITAVQSTIRELVEPHRTHDGYTLPAQALCAVAW